MDFGHRVICALKGKNKGGHFEQWEIVTKTQLPLEQVLCGNIYRDSRFDDGAYIFTTPIVNYYIDEAIVETQNTYYTLGVKHIKDKRPLSKIKSGDI